MSCVKYFFWLVNMKGMYSHFSKVLVPRDHRAPSTVKHDSTATPTFHSEKIQQKKGERIQHPIP